MHLVVHGQIEDILLCEGVQKGLQSPAYSVGRYAPKVEQAMHHFHCLLHENLTTWIPLFIMDDKLPQQSVSFATHIGNGRLSEFEIDAWYDTILS